MMVAMQSQLSPAAMWVRSASQTWLGLLVAEKLLENIPAHMQSLNMLIVTEGRERTADEYSELLRSAGFASVESRRTGTPLDATLALK